MRWSAASAIALVLAAAGCGGDGAEDRAATGGSRVGKETAGSVVQFADCADWSRGSRDERMATVAALRGQLTPTQSRTAEGPLPDERAYEIFDKTCEPEFAQSLRLYKLYVRAQGFAPLSE